MPPTSMSGRPSSACRLPRRRSPADSPYAPDGMPPPIALPITTMSGASPPRAVQPPGPAEIVCVSSMMSTAPYRGRELAEAVVEAALGQHDADVRQRGLGEDGRHVAVRQLAFDAPRGRSTRTTAGGRRRSPPPGRRCPAGARTPSGRRHDERLVDRAVVAVGEDQRPWAGPSPAGPAGAPTGSRRSRSG